MKAVGRLVDVLGTATALVLGACSLEYPMGRDHAELAYVGTRMLHGVPVYRDLWARRPPGAYLLHGIAAAIHPQGIRALEIGSVFAIAAACAVLAAPAKRRAGLFGFAAAFCAVYAFGYTGFWDGAHGDLVVGALALVAGALARRMDLPSGAAAGVCAMAAIAIAPWAAPLAAISIAVAHSRRAVALGAAGLAVALSSVLATTGDLGSVIHRAREGDCLRGPSAIGFWQSLLDAYRHYSPMSGITLVLLIGAVGWLVARHRPLQRFVLPAALFAGAMIELWLEGSFFPAGWAILIGPLAALATTAIGSIARTERWRAWAFANVPFAFWLSWTAFPAWLAQTELTYVVWARGELRDRLAATFVREDLAFDHVRHLRIARWIESHASPNDTVAVRGFEPELYFSIHRSSAELRFFSTPQLTAPICTWQWEPSRATDDADIERARPRFIVALASVETGPDAARTFEEKGWVRRAEDGPFAILER